MCLKFFYKLYTILAIVQSPGNQFDDSNQYFDDCNLLIEGGGGLLLHTEDQPPSLRAKVRKRIDDST